MHPVAQPQTRHVRPRPLQELSTYASVAVWMATLGPILMAGSTLTFYLPANGELQAVTGP
jgi:hypothetical protein